MQDAPLLQNSGAWSRDRGLAATIAVMALGTFALIWQGLDFTDEGWHLHRQFQAVSGSPGYQYSLIWLSEWIGGLWQQLAGSSLLAARIGWALVFTTTAATVYLTVSAYTNARQACLLVLATAAIASYRGQMVINHYFAPMLVLVAAVSLVLASQRGDNRGPARWLAAILGGIFLGLGVMARAPYILALAIPCFGPPLELIARRRMSLGRCGLALTSVTSSIATIAACLLTLHAQGRLPEYLSYLGGNSLDESHSPAALLIAYAFQGVIVAAALVAVLLAGLAGTWFYTRISSKRTQLPFLLATFCGTFALMAVLRILRLYVIGMPGVWLLLAAAAWLWEYATLRRTDRLMLITTAAAVCVQSFVGSNVGLANMQHGLWLVIPVVSLYAPSMLAALARRLFGAIDARGFQRLATAALCGLVLFSLCCRLLDPRRDDRNRLHLTATLKHPTLHGIRTTPERAASVDALLAAAGIWTERGSTVLAYNSVPLVHFATRTEPALGHSWPVNQHREVIRQRLEELEQQTLPAVVIRAKTYPRDRHWGRRQVEPPPAEVAEKLELLDQFVARQGYQEVWSNEDFVILALPNHAEAVATRSQQLR